MLEQPLLPVSARKLILRFVLGPADFIMHHLEWRISLLERVDQLVSHYVTFMFRRNGVCLMHIEMLTKLF